MFSKLGKMAAIALLGLAAEASAREAPAPASTSAAKAAPWGPIRTDRYRANFVKLGADDKDALLFEPQAGGPPSPVAVVFTFPRATFDAVPAVELASRGYRVLWVTTYTEDDTPYDGLAETSAGVRYMRSLPGVEHVVVMSHSGGGRMMAFYAAFAERGPALCQHPGMISQCDTDKASNLAKPDGLVLLDPAPGAINTASAMDPAYDETGKRTRADLDMYAPQNGYDPKSGSASYSRDFIKRFYAAQATRNNAVVAGVKARGQLLDAGKGLFSDDEPLVVPGAVNGGNAASLYHTDLSLLSHTKKPYVLLKADGTTPLTIIHSVRAPTGLQDAPRVNSLCCSTLAYTVRHFLTNDAIRVTPDFALTEDDILGVDWNSSLRSTPASAESITVPTLILSMSCFHFVVPNEVIYDHLAAKDKTYASVEGALHGFTPCKPEYGDTQKRTFDFVAAWLRKPGRF